jgi:hypothetical protein
LDFLQNCRIAPGDSLLRIFRRYLHAAKRQAPYSEHRPMRRSRAG